MTDAFRKATRFFLNSMYPDTMSRSGLLAIEAGINNNADKVAGCRKTCRTGIIGPSRQRQTRIDAIFRHPLTSIFASGDLFA